MQTIKLRFLLIALIGYAPIAKTQQLDPTLKGLIKQGLNKSHSINIHDYDAEQAKVDQSLARSVFLPKVTLNGGFTQLNDNITFDQDTRNLLVATQKLLIKEAIGLPFNAELPSHIPLTPTPNLQDKNILRSSVDVDWVLFTGLEARNALKASQHKEASLQYLSDAEKDKLALKIIATYDQLALVSSSKEVLEASEKYLEEQGFFVKRAIQNGLATPIGLKKIELAKQQLASKELEIEQNRTLLLAVLSQLTGEPRDYLSLLDPQLKTFELLTLADAEKRNEIKALEEAEEATRYQSKMEKSNFIPKVALKGHYEFLEDGLSLLDPKWYVGVGLQWRLFDGNQSRLKSKKSLLEKQKYREQIKESEEMISLSIVKAEHSYQSALQNIKMVQKEIELASATYEMVDKQHKNSLASITEVLDALKDLEQANFKLQESFFDQRRSGIELLHAKGTLVY